jgi:V/A-type H+-transporting ATPase subunit I
MEIREAEGVCIMMVFTVPMRLLTAVVLDEVTEDVKKQLLDLGVLDFIHLSHLAPELSSKLTTKGEAVEIREYQTLRSRIETMFQQAGELTPTSELLDAKKVAPPNLHDITSFVDTLSDDVSALREKQKQLSQQKIRLDELLSYVKEKKTDYIDISIGKVEKGTNDVIRQRFANQAYILLEPESWDDSILLTLQRERNQVNPLLENLQWIENPDGSKQESAITLLQKQLQHDIASNKDQNNQVKEQISKRIVVELEVLREYWGQLRVQELLGHISDNFSHTRNTTIFSGWVPKDLSQKVEKAIKEASGGACVIEWTDDTLMPREEIPVAVEDVPILRPFQKMVDNYSTPEYGTINPTPFVAVSYLAMYGLMFADAGQGLIILLLGLLGSYFLRNDPGIKQRLISKDLYKLFIYLGSSAIVAGAIFGSYFGYPLIKPIWFNYHEAVVGSEATGRDVYTILKITIWFGIIVIGTGLILNWINLVRKKDWFHLLMDKNGVLGGWLFGVGVWAAFSFVGSGYKTLPEGDFLVYALAIPLLLLFGKVPFKRYSELKAGKKVEKKSIGALIMEGVLEWIVDLLEIFAGFLANTLSFMRVAGLGIAHVSLMVAFSDMAQLTHGAASIFILVIGNILVIALEGLSAGIQALRLNYYEFFTKYFTGRGLSYNPISLRPNAGKQIHSRT